MKNLTQKALALAASIFTLGANTALAADAYNFHNLGFSNDGRYFAFVDAVIEDTEGQMRAQGSIVDVEKNLLVKYETYATDDRISQTQAVKAVVAKLGLSSYGISGKIKGTTLWSRAPYDLSSPDLNPKFSTYYGVDGGASSVWPKYQLSVKGLKAPANDECWDGTPTLLSVTLSRSVAIDESTTTTLQQDTRLPKSRGCAFNYQPRLVLENKGAIVVVVRYMSPGWEGPDYNHMVVTHGSALQ